MFLITDAEIMLIKWASGKNSQNLLEWSTSTSQLEDTEIRTFRDNCFLFDNMI